MEYRFNENCCAHILISLSFIVLHTANRRDFARVPTGDETRLSKQTLRSNEEKAHFPIVPSVRVTGMSVTVLQSGFFSGALMGSGAWYTIIPARTQSTDSDGKNIGELRQHWHFLIPGGMTPVMYSIFFLVGLLTAAASLPGVPGVRCPRSWLIVPPGQM